MKTCSHEYLTLATNQIIFCLSMCPCRELCSFKKVVPDLNMVNIENALFQQKEPKFLPFVRHRGG